MNKAVVGLYVNYVDFRAKGEEKTKAIIDWNNIKIHVWDVGSEEVLSPFMENEVVFKHKIAVTCESRKAFFDFYGSVNEYYNGKDRYDDYNLIHVFELILGDAITYLNSTDIDDMARELGIDKPSKAYKVWNGCKRTYHKLKRVLRLSDDEFFELHNELINYINDNL